MLILLVSISVSSSTFQRCISENAGGQTYPSNKQFQEYALAVILYGRCGGRVIYVFRDAITAVATVVIAGSTITLWISTKRISEDSRHQLVITERSARAAEDAARAAISSLSRPWFVIERLTHNEADWLRCKSTLLCRFTVKNYGNAPAIILSIKAAFFRSPGKFGQFPVSPLPKEILNFPSSEELISFISKYANAPLIERTSTDGHEAIQFIPDTEPAIASGEATKELIFRGHGILESFPQGMTIQMATKGYLIGSIGYSILGQTSETINFCYETRNDGRFRILYGAPYNERKQAIDND